MGWYHKPAENGMGHVDIGMLQSIPKSHLGPWIGCINPYKKYQKMCSCSTGIDHPIFQSKYVDLHCKRILQPKFLCPKKVSTFRVGGFRCILATNLHSTPKLAPPSVKVKKFHCQLLETSHCCPEGTPGETVALRNPKWNGSTNQSLTYATTFPSKKVPQTAEVTSKKTNLATKKRGPHIFLLFFCGTVSVPSRFLLGDFFVSPWQIWTNADWRKVLSGNVTSWMPWSHDWWSN